MKGAQVLSSNALKIIGALLMVIDHVGMIFFPSMAIFRIIGRMAFPIFAFCIAEGTRYTKSKLKYFLSVLILGIICQIPMLILAPSAQLNILITFALAILVCYALDYLKKALFCDTPLSQIVIRALLLAVVILAICALSYIKRMEYGAIGCLVPAMASLFYAPSDAPSALKSLDTTWVHALTMGVGVLLQALFADYMWQWIAVFAIPILLFYSGKRGKIKMKWFFYIFYPSHLVLLYAIFFIMSM
ncbi:MAG: hypothetical protein IKA43_00060 [Clostridia bacterium]|nr:hypothetical protein [Clostridia bacterium]